MLVIGLCGGSGSGKGEVGRLLSENGIPVIDTDAVYRELTSYPGECLSALVDEFGSEILTEEGSLDRRKLSKIVFTGEGASERRLRLNEISHRFILDETRRRLGIFEAEGFAAAAVDAPLLFESGFDGECDKTVCVAADRNIRIARIMERDLITQSEAEKRIDSQIPDTKIKELCDYTVINNGTVDLLCESVLQVVHDILKNKR